MKAYKLVSWSGFRRGIMGEHLFGARAFRCGASSQGNLWCIGLAIFGFGFAAIIERRGA